MLKLPIDNIYSLLINLYIPNTRPFSSLYTPNIRAFYSLTIFKNNNIFYHSKPKSPIYILTLHNSNYIYIIDVITCSLLAINEFSIKMHLVTLRLNEGSNPLVTLLFLQSYNSYTYDIIKSIDIFISDSLIQDIKTLNY